MKLLNIANLPNSQGDETVSNTALYINILSVNK